MVEKIKLMFLGTGSSIPTARRNHPAVLLKFKGENILIDCGEGTQRQFRRAGLNPCKITKILISHWHGDHVLGLPGLLRTLKLNGFNKELIIYGPKGSKIDFQEKVVPNLSRRDWGFEIVVNEVGNGVVFDDDDFFVESFELDHSRQAVGYNFVVKEKSRLDKEKLAKLGVGNSPLVGELARGKVVSIDGKKVDGKKFIYVEKERKVSFVCDTRYNDSIVKFVKVADLLVSEATYSKDEQEIADEYGHLSSVGAAMIAKKGKVGGLVLMHLSQRYDEIPKVILGEAKDYLKGTKIGVVVPEDLDVVEL